MTRPHIPFEVNDISALARSLVRALKDVDETPGHVEMLNMLARSAGYRNFQHFRAQATAQARMDRSLVDTGPRPEPPDLVIVERVARLFDRDGILTRWPGKHGHRMLCLWVFWSRFPARVDFTEIEVNDRLQSGESFGDHVLLRRCLVDYGMMQRSRDCRVYRRIEQTPPLNALELIRHLRARQEREPSALTVRSRAFALCNQG